MTNVKKDCDCSKSFAEILTNLMKERETTQKELAEHIGITRQAISQYTKGITQPTADIIVKIAKFFNVSTDYMLGVSAEKSADMDIQGACKFFGVSEKTIQGIYANIDLIKNNPNGAAELLEVFERFVNMSNGVFNEIAAAILHVRIAKDLDNYMKMPVYQKFIGIHYTSKENNVDYMEFKMYKWVKDYCINTANAMHSLFSDEEIEELQQSNSFEEIILNLVPHSTVMRKELLNLFCSLAQLRPGIATENPEIGNFRFEE